MTGLAWAADAPAAAAGGSLSVEFPATGGAAFVLLLPLLQPAKAEPI